MPELRGGLDLIAIGNIGRDRYDSTTASGKVPPCSRDSRFTACDQPHAVTACRKRNCIRPAHAG